MKDKSLHQEIRTLKREILSEEIKIYVALQKENYDNVKKASDKIKSNLKYLSIIVNGAPIEPKENMQIMGFLRMHYETLWRLPVTT